MPELSNFSLNILITGEKFVLTEELKKTLLLKNIFVYEKLNTGEAPFKCIFLVGGFLTGRQKVKKSLAVETLNYARRTGSRVLIVLPYVINNKDRRTLEMLIGLYKQNRDIDCYLLFVGELFGNESFGKFTTLSRGIVNEYVQSGQIGVTREDFKIYPVSVIQCIERLLKICFSYGNDRRVLILAQNISAYGFLNLVKEVIPSVRFYERAGKIRVSNAGNFQFDDIKISKTEIKDAFTVPKRVFTVANPKKMVTKKPRRYLAFLFLLLIVILSPFISLFISGVSLKISYNSLLAGRFGSSNTGFQVANKSASFASWELSSFKFLKKPKEVSEILRGVSSIGIHMARTAENAQVIAKNIFGESEYNIVELSNNISLDSDFSYQELSFLELNYPDFTKFFNGYSPHLRLDTIRNYLLSARNLSLSLPDLLGVNTRKTYLVLFQNDSELRPTGGFIGSFGLLTFESGHLVDRNMFDVYTADGQLTGHVEPPTPIKKYLGEANWYLRDSNWDPDFGTTAAKAEWFLDKELNKSVDGVVGIDFEAVKSFLTSFGSIDVEGAGKIDSVNLYEKIQNDVQEGFFPGSYKKTNLLVSLTDGVVNKLSQLKNSDYLNFARLGLQNLNERHIQIFSHDETTSVALNDLSWDGGVSHPSCGVNCQTIWFGEVEANVGVNKVNYYMQRKSYFTSVYNKGVWQNSLEIDLKNTASATNKPLKQYKTYVRALTDKEAVFGSVNIIDNGGVRNVNPDMALVSGRIEAGVLAIIAPQTTGKIIFKWSEPATVSFVKSGGVGIYWRKQAGTVADPVTVKVSIPRFATSYPDYNLTHDGFFSYNTTLASDLFPKIFW